MPAARSGGGPARTQGAGLAGGKSKPEDAVGRAPDPRDAFALAVGAIARKERTIAELRQWLRVRDVSAAEADEALERLIAIGELDDERFAQRYAADKRALRGWGPDRIREALLERGIERSIAEAAAGADEPAEQAERAAELLLGRRADLADNRGRQRAVAYLARRGYDPDVAYEAVRVAERRASPPERRAA